VRTNEFGQTIGEPITWSPRPTVGPVTLAGRSCTVRPYAVEQVSDLFASTTLESPPSTWTYISAGPFPTADGLRGWLDRLAADPGAVPHVICLPDERPVGIASYHRLDSANGSVEVGGIVFSAALQRTTAATESMYLMARHVFEDLGYRRYEWKCDSGNVSSQRAAARLGFRYEGTFRNAQVYKGRNRDTDWFSITDAEWPAVRTALEGWLDPANFDAAGQQIAPLRSPTSAQR
jgi:RimJ/RimL family protein N-acetyltransferase